MGEKMTILTIKNIEKHSKDTVLFPPFSLKVEQHEITAIYSTLNARSTLLEMFTGETSTSGGEIRVNGVTFAENKTTYYSQLGICFFEEGLYERLTVRDYFKFYKDLYQIDQTFDQLFLMTQLGEKRSKRMKDLSYSEKKRVQYGRLLIQNPSLFIFEEPDLNVDVETKRVLVNIVNKLKQEGKSILILTGNMESAITMADFVYRLDESGLKLIETDKEKTVDEADKLDGAEAEIETQPIQFNKIPTKVNEKIVLFDPPEIDYIESNDGQSNIYIKGDAFPSTLTLNNLEERLHPYGFFRCHRSYIVNLQKVREVITWTRNSYTGYQ
ncbi:LytTR family transcriptional regulator DNA-binding domain-containing protein [Virgibacillus indicus]|nr:LytTR family transcriptional regulator DNA-binding domain-containing protein [Virgibacillus indicus]